MDGAKVLTSAQSGTGAALGNADTFSFTLAIEAGFESVPDSILQALALAQTIKQHGQASNMQFASLGISLAHIGFFFATVTTDFETSETLKIYNPDWFGLFPSGPRRHFVLPALVLFCLCYLAARLVAISALGGVSLGALMVYLACELMGLLFIRMALGNWRLFTPAGDYSVISFISHVLYFSIVNAAPLPSLRCPWYLVRACARRGACVAASVLLAHTLALATGWAPNHTAAAAARARARVRSRRACTQAASCGSFSSPTLS